MQSLLKLDNTLLDYEPYSNNHNNNPVATTEGTLNYQQHHQLNNKYARYNNNSLWGTSGTDVGPVPENSQSPTTPIGCVPGTPFNMFPPTLNQGPYYEGAGFHHQKYWPSSRYARRMVITPKDTPIKMTLENKTMIERFDKYCTEMIITKTGRLVILLCHLFVAPIKKCLYSFATEQFENKEILIFKEKSKNIFRDFYRRMFPSPQITVLGMESAQKYFVLFDVTPADDNRYKFHHFNWVIAGKAEPLPPVRFYIHPESPLTGAQWMKQQITFQKVKLTNNTCDQHGHVSWFTTNSFLYCFVNFDSDEQRSSTNNRLHVMVTFSCITKLYHTIKKENWRCFQKIVSNK